MSAATPYLTVPELLSAPTGISWNTIPSRASSVAAQQAEQTNICWRATHMIDEYCNQPLRATLDTETLTGPDARLTVQNNGVAQFVTERWPILAVVSGKCSPAAAFPPVWVPMTPDNFIIHSPAVGLAGSSAFGAAGGGASRIEVSPGFVSWFAGRNGYRLEITYINGWPHTGLTAAVLAGAQTIEVDDCTGWGTGSGVLGTFRDGVNTETVLATATSVTSGPGTVTLATPLQYPHAVGIAFTAMPWSIQQAAILYATGLALLRGATALTAQSSPGSMTSGGKGTDDLYSEAEVLLDPYRRVF